MHHSIANPRRLRQLGYGAIATGAALGAVSSLLRDTGDDRAWTYLLDAIGWLLAVASAVAEARVSAILSAFQPDRERRRATVLLCTGIGIALGACALLSTITGEGIAIAVRFVSAALLIGGIGSGIGGGLSLAITSGARYAADRLADLDDR